jgi:hypothetical protein
VQMQQARSCFTGSFLRRQGCCCVLQMGFGCQRLSVTAGDTPLQARVRFMLLHPHTLRQLMHMMQDELSCSFALWNCIGQPSDARPSSP